MATEYDVTIYSNVTISGYDVEEERGWSQRLTWKELAERQAAEITELRRWQKLCNDLDRCEHGRHEGDICSSCGGPSKGNRLIGHAPIGHTMDTHHIFSPDRSRRNDPAEWVVHGPCRDAGQAGTPCPIGPAYNGAYEANKRGGR